MQLNLNWIQRGILILAGLLFAVASILTLIDHSPDRWLAMALSVLAIACFLFASTYRARPDG
jgi:uncharacterized membrane protein YccC